VTLSPAGAVEARPVGRDREWQRIDEFTRAFPDTGGSLVLRGPVGMGKTTLWRAALARHRQLGHRVLVTRPAEEELHGQMVGLVDLFDGVDVAAGLLDLDTDIFDRGRAALATLRRLVDSSPVVVAVDDVQWLDAVSRRSLWYALRRLEHEPIGLVATQRLSRPGVDRTDVQALERVTVIEVGPLPLQDLRRVLATVVEAIPRPMLEHIHQLSHGNPMYAIELVRAAGGDELGSSAPSNLAAALATRLAGLTPDVRALLEIAAGLGPVPVAALERAAGRDHVAGALTVAVERDLLVVDEQLVVRFSHPMLASLVVASMNPLARRSLHARLAPLAADDDARARHLALCTFEPDAGVARTLQGAAERAARRGAPALAAELVAHARRVTPPDDEAGPERALAEVAYRAASGETGRALAMADDLLATLPAGRRRVEAITQRVFLDTARSEPFLAHALAEAADDEVLQGRVLDLQAWITAISRGRLADGIALCERALVLAERTADEELEMLVSGTLATASLLAGRPRPDMLAAALAIAERRGGPPLGRWPQVFEGRHALWGGDLVVARRRFVEMREVFDRSGSEFQRPYRLHDLALVEVAAGALRTAAELVDDGMEAATDAGNAQAKSWLAYPEGLVHVHLGDAERAERAAARLEAWGRDCDEPPRVAMAHHVRGLRGLAAGDPAGALDAFAAGVDLLGSLGYHHPGVIPVLADGIEAAVLGGHAEHAQGWADRLGAQAAVLAQPWVDAAHRRACALLTRDADGLARAAATFDALGYRLDAARSTVLLGQALRRAGQRSAAADVLCGGHDRLVAAGAAPWAALAAHELDRVAPGRSTGELTPTEVSVAELVVAGRRNREIAAELYVSVATVEAHLTRMYRKLGVRSRTELARSYAPDASSGRGD
jgi:DNA-binding NarL/FixJ family response regulator